MKTLAISAALLLLGSSAFAETKLYDTFNESDKTDLFDCCAALVIGGEVKGLKLAVNLPFKPRADGRITEIDIPLFYTLGASREMRVILRREKHNDHIFKVKDLDLGGQCCKFFALTAHGMPVKKGVTYHLIVQGINDTVGGWNLNTKGDIGTYFVKGLKQEGVLPAVRMLGK